MNVTLSRAATQVVTVAYVVSGTATSDGNLTSSTSMPIASRPSYEPGLAYHCDTYGSSRRPMRLSGATVLRGTRTLRPSGQGHSILTVTGKVGPFEDHPTAQVVQFSSGQRASAIVLV